jgi:hypothetical protein
MTEQTGKITEELRNSHSMFEDLPSHLSAIEKAVKEKTADKQVLDHLEAISGYAYQIENHLIAVDIEATENLGARGRAAALIKPEYRYPTDQASLR